MTILLIVAVLEVCFVLIGYTFVREKHWNRLFVFYNNLGNQIVLWYGILTTVLLLPVEKFAVSESDYVELSGDSDGEGGNTPKIS